MVESQTIHYKTETGFIKHLKISVENPRDFKLGVYDKFFVRWGGASWIDEVTEYTSQNEIDELNGNIEPNPDTIDLVSGFWRCVRKVME